MASNLEPIREQVRRLTTVVDSNKALLTNLTQRILDAGTLEEAQAIAREVQDQVDELNADVVANTPADPNNPAPTPTPDPNQPTNQARTRR